MANFNKVILMGHVTRPIEVRNIPSNNTAVARTGLAVNQYRGKDKEQETMFVDIVAFGRTAEIMGEYVAKGSNILIDGRLSFNTWEQDGQRRSKHEVIVDTFQMVGKRDEADEKPTTSSYRNDNELDEDDIAF